MTFEDDLTRELPSALRTFTDLEPYRSPPSSTTELGDEDLLEDDEVLRSGRTLQLPPASRPLSIPAFSHDIPAPPITSSIPVLLREPLALVIGAALLLGCMSAAMLGIALGHASAASHAAISTRLPRIPVVLAAHEAITEPAATAPMKLTDEPEAPPAPLPRPRPIAKAARSHEPPPPSHRAGFQRPIGLPPQPAPSPPRAHR